MYIDFPHPENRFTLVVTLLLVYALLTLNSIPPLLLLSSDRHTALFGELDRVADQILEHYFELPGVCMERRESRSYPPQAGESGLVTEPL